jgi:hypothetical protein
VIVRNQPDVLAFHDVNAKGVRRWPRIKKLHREVLALAKRDNLKVIIVSAKKLRLTPLGKINGTKHEVAELYAADSLRLVSGDRP